MALDWWFEVLSASYEGHLWMDCDCLQLLGGNAKNLAVMTDAWSMSTKLLWYVHQIIIKFVSYQHVWKLIGSASSDLFLIRRCSWNLSVVYICDVCNRKLQHALHAVNCTVQKKNLHWRLMPKMMRRFLKEERNHLVTWTKFSMRMWWKEEGKKKPFKNYVAFPVPLVSL